MWPLTRKSWTTLFSWISAVIAPPKECRWEIVARRTPLTCFAWAIALAGASLFFGRWAPTLLWAAALTTIGWLLGFLFAFPRPAARTSLPGGDTENQSAPIQATFPDSMSEIADWLTKIIVGLGLVNLQAAPDQLRALGERVATSIVSEAELPRPIEAKEAQRPESDATPRKDSARGGEAPAPRESSRASGAPLPVEGAALQADGTTTQQSVETISSRDPRWARWVSFAQGFAVFFLVDGLILGYLITRLYLLAALNFADREAAEQKSRPFPTEPEEVYPQSVETAARMFNSLRTPGVGVQGVPEPRSEATLRCISAQYVATKTKDFDTRVVQKNALMQQMFAVAVASGASKKWLAEQPGDGFAHVLATMILAEPAAGDLDLLLARARSVDQRHAQYRVTEAFQRLAESRLLPPASRVAVKDVLEFYAKDADGSLKSRLDATRSVIDRMAA